MPKVTQLPIITTANSQTYFIVVDNKITKRFNYQSLPSAFAGFSGSQGPIGIQGGFGYSGSQGFDGNQGPIGSKGYTGSFGFKGFTGSSGIGYSGSESDVLGPTGYTGSVGMGYSGSASDVMGPLGYSGSIGSIGNYGYTGSSGIDGVTVPIKGSVASATTSNFDVILLSGTPNIGDGYIADDTGNTWIYTETGPILGFSNAGVILGPQGITGYSGSIGIIGYTGSFGRIGFIGSTGPRGYSGSRGLGNIGYSGSIGSSGTKGYTGSNGVVSVLTPGNYTVGTLIVDALTVTAVGGGGMIQSTGDLNLMSHGQITANTPFVLPTFTISQLPALNSATQEGAMVYVSDATPPQPCFFNGTHWFTISGLQQVA